MLKLADLAVRSDFALGPLRVSPARRQVSGPLGEIHVEPLIMQVFLLLADAEGNVVTRATLFDEVWGGVEVGDYSLNRAVTMVRRIATEVAPGAFVIENIPRTGYRLVTPDANQRTNSRFIRLEPVAFGVAALVVVASTAWLNAANRANPPSIAVVAKGQEPLPVELADRIARAATSRRVSDKPPFEVLSSENSAKSDLVLEVRRFDDRSSPRTDLSLLWRRKGSLLWVASLQSERGQTGDLDQETVTLATAALDCAIEVYSAGGTAVGQATARRYVDSCSKFDASHGAELALLANEFANVAAAAPQLNGAWSRLFVSKVETVDMQIGSTELNGDLAGHLERARAHGIEVPETYIAERALLPRNARLERLRIIDAGLAKYPDNLLLLLDRSWQLRSVGRMADAAAVALVAVRKYPKSPAAYTEYANSLMYSGRIDAARAVLRQAASIAPGSRNIASSFHRLEMRYGNPRHALAALQSGDFVGGPQLIGYLRARMEPGSMNIERSLISLGNSYRADPRDPAMIVQALGEFGRTEQAIQLLLAYPYAHVSGDVAEILFRPSLANVRRDPRFMLIARRFGVADYWRRSGNWPDFCTDPDLPYSCNPQLAQRMQTKLERS